MTKIKRETLIGLCEKGIVPVGKWSNRDTPEAQAQLAKAWAYLKAGCPYVEDEEMGGGDQTIWLRITHPTFGTFDWDAPNETELFYIPSEKRLTLVDGGDWY